MRVLSGVVLMWIGITLVLLSLTVGMEYYDVSVLSKVLVIQAYIVGFGVFVVGGLVITRGGKVVRQNGAEVKNI